MSDVRTFWQPAVIGAVVAVGTGADSAFSARTNLVQKITDRPLYLGAPTTHPRSRIVMSGIGCETDAKLNLYATSNSLARRA